MADTKNLYVCTKPYQAGETMISPSEDPEHWALYMPQGEKGESGPQGSPLWVGTVRSVSSTILFDPVPGAKIGDYIQVGKVPSTTYDILLGNIYIIHTATKFEVTARSIDVVGNARGPAGKAGPRGAKWGTTSTKINVTGVSQTVPASSIVMDVTPEAGDFIVSRNAESDGTVAVLNSYNEASDYWTVLYQINIKGPAGADGAVGKTNVTVLQYSPGDILALAPGNVYLAITEAGGPINSPIGWQGSFYSFVYIAFPRRNASSAMKVGYAINDSGTLAMISGPNTSLNFYGNVTVVKVSES